MAPLPSPQHFAQSFVQSQAEQLQWPPDNVAARYVAELDSSIAIGYPGRPVYEADFVILGSLWVMREIELAWATRKDISIDHSAAKIAWRVPVSKTDPVAKACVRSWGCLCSEFPATLCPYHRWVGLTIFLKKGITLHDDLQIFPDSQGRIFKKTDAVNAIENCLKRV